jgi:outer membrane protein
MRNFHARRPCIHHAALLLVTCLLPATATWAQARPDTPASNWSLGVLGSTETSPYRGADSQQRLLPLLGFENAYVRVTGPMIDLKLPSTGPVSYALIARYTDTGYEASDSSALKGMGERKSSIWLGAKADWRLPMALLSAQWMGDAGGHSGGQQLRLVAEKPMGWGGLRLAPRVGLVWQDRDYVDYYFGVRNAEAGPGRAAYAGKSALNAELGLRAIYGFTAEQSVFMDVSAIGLGSAIQSSPLVGRNWATGLRLGYAYRF